MRLVPTVRNVRRREACCASNLRRGSASAVRLSRSGAPVGSPPPGSGPRLRSVPRPRPDHSLARSDRRQLLNVVRKPIAPRGFAEVPILIDVESGGRPSVRCQSLSRGVIDGLGPPPPCRRGGPSAACATSRNSARRRRRHARRHSPLAVAMSSIASSPDPLSNALLPPALERVGNDGREPARAARTASVAGLPLFRAASRDRHPCRTAMKGQNSI